MSKLELRRLDAADANFDAALGELIAFESAQDASIDAVVAGIVADVRARGDAALLEYTQRFDRMHAASVAELEVPQQVLRDAFDSLPADQRDALMQAAERVRRYHERQKAPGFAMKEPDGS